MDLQRRDQLVKALYASGAPVKDIAKHVSLTRTGLYMALKRLGLDIRSPARMEATRTYKKEHPKVKPECKFPSCGRSGRGKSGYCEAHYNQYKKNGRLTEIQIPGEKQCKAPGCTKTARSLGYCLKDRVKFVGKFPYQLKRKKCRYKPQPCDNRAQSRGYCGKHYQLLKDEGLLVTVPFQRYLDQCIMPACDRAHYSRGYCRKDYTRLTNQGLLKPLRPKNTDNQRENKEKLSKVG